jgi:hypothetical protein
MTAEGWDLHPWATHVEPGGIIGTREARNWRSVLDGLEGAYDLTRLAAWVRIVDDGPRVVVVLNPDIYTQEMVSGALEQIKPFINRCLREGPGVDDAWQVSIGADGRLTYDMPLLATTDDQAGLLQALETLEILETSE